MLKHRDSKRAREKHGGLDNVDLRCHRLFPTTVFETRLRRRIVEEELLARAKRPASAVLVTRKEESAASKLPVLADVWSCKL